MSAGVLYRWAGAILLSLWLAAAPGAALAQEGQLRIVPIAEAVRAIARQETVEVIGVMTAQIAPGWFFMQDESGGIRVTVRQPIPLKNGDRIRVVLNGIGARDWYQGVRAEVIGEAALPAPVFVRGDQAEMTQYDSQRVTVQGRVTGMIRRPVKYKVGDRWLSMVREVLFAESGGVQVEFSFEPEEKAFEQYPVGMLGDFTGVLRYVPESNDPEARTIHITIRGSGNVRVLELPPLLSQPVARRWMIRLGGGAAVAICAGIGLFVWRRRRERHARAELRRLNAELEARVAERTSELQASNESLRHSEERLAKALEQQTQLLELKTNFVSLVSHEFRTPLEVITSAAFNLDRYHDRMPPEKRRQSLDTIQRAVQRMTGMMEQVLFLGRIEPGKTNAERSPLDLPDFCLRLRDEIESATERRCPIELTIGDELTGARGDAGILRHIFVNLLSNAVKYSAPGVPVQFEVRRDGTHAVCIVRDHGRGIPEADQAHLFEAFHRGSNVGNIAGTGLGLIIVQRCVEAEGGSVEWTSREGEGTTFTVRLPLFASQRENLLRR